MAGQADSELMLVEEVASRLFEWLGAFLADTVPRRICLIAGRGNNGSDGLGLLCHLAKEGRHRLGAILMDGTRQGVNACMLARAVDLGVTTLQWHNGANPDAIEELSQADVIIEGLCGRGLSSALRHEAAELVVRLNAASGLKLAIDLPAGFRYGMEKDDTVFRSDYCLCIYREAVCLYASAFRAYAGRIQVIAQALFQDQARSTMAVSHARLEPHDLPGLLPISDPDSHKNSRGRLLVLGGSADYPGALSLAAEAGGRSGAGYVMALSSEIPLSVLRIRHPSIVTKTLGQDPTSEIYALGDYGAMLAGNGWNLEEAELLKALITVAGPLVLDAGALRLLARYKGDIRFKEDADHVLLTPHPGEAAELLGLSIFQIRREPWSAAKAIAERYGCVCLLKDSVSWISDGRGLLWVFDGRLGHLACAGSGDVLAGFCAGFMARGLSAIRAAQISVLAHYAGALLARDSLGYFLAEDLSGYIALALRKAEITLEEG